MRIDLHVHTNYSSDGCSSVIEILKFVKKRGLGGIAITDHNTMAGVREALCIKDYIKRLGIIVIPGVEISWFGAHFLAWGVLTNPGTPVLAQKEALLTAVAHPYDYRRHGRPYFQFAKAIEVFNSSAPPWANWLARRSAKKRNAIATAGSDAHIAYVVGNAGVIVPDDVSSPEDVIEYILHGKYQVYGKYNSPFYRIDKIARNFAKKLRHR